MPLPALTANEIKAARVWFDRAGELTPAGNTVFASLKSQAHEHFRDALSAAIAIATIALLGGGFLVHAGQQWSERENTHTQFWVGLLLLGIPAVAYVAVVVTGLIRRGAAKRDTYLSRIEAIRVAMRTVALLDEEAYSNLLTKTHRRETTRRGARLALKGAVNGIFALAGLPLGDITDLT